MSQILPSQDELLAHAAAEPAFAAWLQGHGPLQHSAETRAIPKSSPLETLQQAVRAVLDGDTWWPPQDAAAEALSEEAKAASAGLASLTPQQFRVLTMVCEGLLNKQIAYDLNVSEATVKAHVTAIFRKLNVRTRTQAALLLQQMETVPASH